MVTDEGRHSAAAPGARQRAYACHLQGSGCRGEYRAQHPVSDSSDPGYSADEG